SNLPTLVHCYGGLGRTGMILALYLVRRKGVRPESAITQIRQLQPGSIEPNTGQEEVIYAAKYEDK
ncbi:MAG: dual specificity protein phosphatase family protein, partial [Promethearchaeota archaeon]